MTGRWFHVEQGERRGPCDLAELTGLLQADKLPYDTHVWTPGMESWTAAADVPEISRKLPPPVVPSIAPTPKLQPIAPPTRAQAGLRTQHAGAAHGIRPRTTNRLDPLLLVGIVLLLTSVVGCAILFSGPQAPGPEVSGKLGEVTLYLGILSATVTRLVPALRRRFLGWSLVIFAVPLLLFVGSILIARHEKTRLAGQMREVSAFIESSLRGDAKHGQPDTKRTLSPDNPMAPIQSFFAEMAGDLDSMERELQAAGAVEAFHLGMLSNAPQLREQLKVRRTKQEILQRYQATMMAKIDSWKLELNKSVQSPDMRAGMQKGLVRGKERQAQMFALRLREMEAEESFLECERRSGSA